MSEHRERERERVGAPGGPCVTHVRDEPIVGQGLKLVVSKLAERTQVNRLPVGMFSVLSVLAVLKEPLRGVGGG